MATAALALRRSRWTARLPLCPQIHLPTWVDIIKTGAFKELPPQVREKAVLASATLRPCAWHGTAGRAHACASGRQTAQLYVTHGAWCARWSSELCMPRPCTRSHAADPHATVHRS